MRRCTAVVILAIAWVTHVVEPAATARLPTVTGQVVSTGERPVFLAGVAVSLIGAEATYRDTTDEMGRFRFGGVAQGRYRLRAAKAGYVTTEFGALQAGGDGSFVTLAERDEVELSIVLPRAASVSGTVRGPDGAPAPDVLVTITSNAGRSDLVWTDRRGEYRFHSLLPGEYVMSARPRGGLERFLYPAVSMAERQLDATLEALRRGGVAADRKSEEPPRFLGMPTIYYPGTVEPSAAGEIILQVATDLVGIDFALVAGGTSRLSGRVVGLEGPPPAGSQLLAVDTLSKTSYGGAMNNDGTFAFSNLPPGEYAIRVRIVDPSTGRSATVGARQVASWGQTTVWVSGDVQDVAVWLRPPIRIRGSVRQAGEPVSSSLSHAPLQVELTRLPRGVTPPILSVVSSEGTFSLEGVDPGVYSLDVRGVSHDGMTWKLRTASAVGRDLLAPFEVTPESGDISDVVLQLSTRSSTLAGRVTTSEAQPVSEYYVIAFPTDTGMWVEGSRRLLLTRPDQDGRYVFKDIPEGEYHVAVLADRPGEWQSRAFLQSATLFSARTIVEHAHTTTLDLRLVR